MRILICSFSENAGIYRVLRIMKHISNMKKINLFVNQFDTFTPQTSHIHIDYTINFYKVYPCLKQYDHVVLCVRDLRCLSNDIEKMLDYIQSYQCWKIFTSFVIKYEFFNVRDIQELCRLLQTKLSYNDMTNILNSVPLVNYCDKTDTHIKNKYVREYLMEHQYIQSEHKMKQITSF